MDPTLRKAFVYWRVLGTIDTVDTLARKNRLSDGLREKAYEQLITKFDLDESIEHFADAAYQGQLMESYGKDMATSPLPVCKAMMAAREAAKVKPEYKSFAEIRTLNPSELSPAMRSSTGCEVKTHWSFCQFGRRATIRLFKRSKLRHLSVRRITQTQQSPSKSRWPLQVPLALSLFPAEGKV